MDIVERASAWISQPGRMCTLRTWEVSHRVTSIARTIRCWDRNGTIDLWRWCALCAGAGRPRVTTSLQNNTGCLLHSLDTYQKIEIKNMLWKDFFQKILTRHRIFLNEMQRSSRIPNARKNQMVYLIGTSNVFYLCLGQRRLLPLYIAQSEPNAAGRALLLLLDLATKTRRHTDTDEPRHSRL